MAIQFKHSLGIAAIALLTACGGGGGGGGGPVFGLPLPDSGTGTGGPSGPPETETPAPVGDAPPQARVAKPVDPTLGLVLKLDGTKSQAAEGRSLSYAWVLQSKPLFSKAVLLDTGSATPSFIPDVAGEFVVRLVVNDGAKDSEAVDVTITPVTPAATGPQLKFAMIETLAAPDMNTRYIPDIYCTGNRPEKYLEDFWPTGFEIGNCSFLNPFPDFERGGFGVGAAGDLAFVTRRMSEFIVAVPGTYPTDTATTSISTAYEIGANPVILAQTPRGRSAGFYHRYTLQGARMIYQPDDPRIPDQRPKARYRLVGTTVPANAPIGWEVAGRTSVRITVKLWVGTSFPGSQVTVYSKTFDSDFSENVELDLNAAVYQVVPNTQGTYDVEVQHQLMYRRKPS